MKNLSIVVVSLNSKDDFIKTINSIISQTYKKKEIIIIDGLSSDGTIEQIQKFKKYFAKIVIEKDKGIYDAMNKGISFSSGKWTMFLNSGDIFYKKDVLEKIFKQKLSGNDILFGDTLIKNKKIKYLVKAKNFTINTIVMPFCHQSTIVKTKIIKHLMFSLKYKYSSDFHFFFRCFIKKKNF
jgi:glycosyltransferase involved in cell wall biosynthesis